MPPPPLMSPPSHCPPPDPRLYPWATHPPPPSAAFGLSWLLSGGRSPRPQRLRAKSVCIVSRVRPGLSARSPSRGALALRRSPRVPRPHRRCTAGTAAAPSRGPRVRPQSSRDGAVTETCLGRVTRASPRGRTGAHTCRRRDRVGEGTQALTAPHGTVGTGKPRPRQPRWLRGAGGGRGAARGVGQAAAAEPGNRFFYCGKVNITQNLLVISVAGGDKQTSKGT